MPAVHEIMFHAMLQLRETRIEETPLIDEHDRSQKQAQAFGRDGFEDLFEGADSSIRCLRSAMVSTR